jgi:hypothetical protein
VKYTSQTSSDAFWINQYTSQTSSDPFWINQYTRQYLHSTVHYVCIIINFRHDNDLSFSDKHFCIKILQRLISILFQEYLISSNIHICTCKLQYAYYFRNIFFRVLNLIQLGVKPVFVVDGTPPEVKWDTIQKRLGLSSGPSRGNSYSRTSYRDRGGTSQKMSRSHFKRLANEVDYLWVFD